MILPSFVLIRGHRYKVEYVETPREVVSDFNTESYRGICDDGLIRVHVEQDMFGTLDTFIHECLHAILIKNKALGDSVNNEESFVTTMANEIACFLVNNGFINLGDLKPEEITKRLG